MALSIKKLPFPKELAVIDYELSLNIEGISEDGEPMSALTKKGKCIFSEKAKRVIDSDGKQIELLGRVIIEGDIAPSLPSVSDGAISINGRTYEIHTGSRPRNPDGTVHHTLLEVR